LTGGLVGCGENAVPENPGWKNDIRPMMEAHCIRCHGGGGKLNGDPDVPPGSLTLHLPTGPLPLPCAAVPDGGAYTCAPVNGNFTTQAGLQGYGAGLQMYLNAPMPPPPSEPLTSYEYDTLMKWESNPLP
jgi:hypothetical protein